MHPLMMHIFGLIITTEFTLQKAATFGYSPTLKLIIAATVLGLGFGG